MSTHWVGCWRAHHVAGRPMNPDQIADGVRRDADPICCCGHKPSDHRGRYYALPTGTCAPGCSLCNCAWLCVMTFEFHALNDGGGA